MGQAPSLCSPDTPAQSSFPNKCNSHCKLRFTRPHFRCCQALTVIRCDQVLLFYSPPPPQVTTSASGLLKRILVLLANLGLPPPLHLSLNKPVVSSWLGPAGHSAPKSPNLQLCLPSPVPFLYLIVLVLPSRFTSTGLIPLHSEGEPLPETPRSRGWPSQRSWTIPAWASACVDSWRP